MAKKETGANAIGDKSSTGVPPVNHGQDGRATMNHGQDGRATLMAAALAAYDIDPQYVLASKFYPETGEMVIVTDGGSKVRYREGDHPQPLSSIAVTGINPEADKRKIIAGAPKK